MEKRRNKFIAGFVITSAILLTGLVFIGSYMLQKPTSVANSQASVMVASELEKPSNIDTISPDGKYTLTMQSLKTPDGDISQAFSVSTDADLAPQNLYSKVSNPDSIISIPFNTFSPDNKFIFLKFADSGKTKHVVLRTDGAEIAKGSQTVEIESKFYEEYPDFVITDITGWGGVNLIVVNTNYNEGKIGPSWWFDLSNKSFIKLSTRFN